MEGSAAEPFRAFRSGAIHPAVGRVTPSPYVDHMASHEQEFSKNQIDRAGATLRRFGVDPPVLDQAAIDDYEHAVRTVGEYRRSFGDALQRVRMGLTSVTSTLDIKGVAITQRAKRFQRIVAKLARFPTIRLSQMQDIGGIRVVVDGLDEAEGMSDHITKAWHSAVVRHDNYIRAPQSSGYRAHHIVVLRQGRPIEIQIRTERQHEWAIGVENASLDLGIELKWGGGPQVVRQRLRSLAEIAAHLDRSEDVLAKLLALARAYHEPSTAGIVEDEKGGATP